MVFGLHRFCWNLELMHWVSATVSSVVFRCFLSNICAVSWLWSDSWLRFEVSLVVHFVPLGSMYRKWLVHSVLYSSVMVWICLPSFILCCKYSYDRWFIFRRKFYQLLKLNLFVFSLQKQKRKLWLIWQTLLMILTIIPICARYKILILMLNRFGYKVSLNAFHDYYDGLISIFKITN